MSGNSAYMISVDEALERVLHIVTVLDAEEKPILDCLGQIAAEDIYSQVDVPQSDNSAMDGYALIAADTTGATAGTPVILRVIGELAAGALPSIRVEPGTAVRIMTGALFPEGADAMVPF